MIYLYKQGDPSAEEYLLHKTLQTKADVIKPVAAQESRHCRINTDSHYFIKLHTSLSSRPPLSVRTGAHSRAFPRIKEWHGLVLP